MHGIPDIRGVYRAPLEEKLQIIEIFVDSILLGYTVKGIRNMSYHEFHEHAFLSYWIIIDLTIMFMTQVYNYFTSVTCQETEIIKNVCSLVHIQQNKSRAIKEMSVNWHVLKTNVEDEVAEREKPNSVANVAKRI